MIIPMVIAAVFLGRAFDIRMVLPTSRYIFDNDAVKDNIMVIEKPFTRTHYSLIEDSSDVSNFLGVSGELCLKVKNGDIGIQGSGIYLSSTVNREKTVEILISVYHESVTETFPSYITQRDDWKVMPQSEVGTHYIRSIIYGGQLIISYKIKAKKTEYMEDIKAAVKANLDVNGRLDAAVKGDLEKVFRSVMNKSDIAISAFATTGIFNPPNDLDSVFKLVEYYPEMVKKVNNGKGAPLRLELIPLRTLNPNYQGYSKIRVVSEIMDDATNKYDDLRVAMEMYHDWEGSGDLWPEEFEPIVADYGRHLKRAKKAMQVAINNMDLSQEIDPHHFDAAFSVYGEGVFNIPNRFTRNLTRLMHIVKNEPFYWFPYTTAVTHYIHWGRVNCSLPSSDPLMIGIAAASPIGYGNGGNIQCLDALDPKVERFELRSSSSLSTINGLTFRTPNGRTGPLFCAFCRLENATAAITVTARTECPGGMKLEYQGYLATSTDAVSEYICIDDNPEDSSKYIFPTKDETASRVEPMMINCPSCDENEEKKYIPCVVCSR